MNTIFVNIAGTAHPVKVTVKGATATTAIVNAGGGSVTSLSAPGGATLLWSEDFNEPAGTFPANWIADISGENQNAQANLAANAYQDGLGHLVLAAKAGACTDAQGRSFEFSGAQIFGCPALTVPNPGFLEWYAEMPMVQGVWPTLWTMGVPVTAWPACGETDVAEIQTAASMKEVYSTLHFPGPAGAAQYGGGALGASRTSYRPGWHKWGCFWNGSSVEMYLDEVLFWTATETDVVAAGGTWKLDKPQCPFLSIYVDGPAAGNPASSTPWPVLMTIDWVRCYTAVPYTTTT